MGATVIAARGPRAPVGGPDHRLPRARRGGPALHRWASRDLAPRVRLDPAPELDDDRTETDEDRALPRPAAAA